MASKCLHNKCGWGLRIYHLRCIKMDGATGFKNEANAEVRKTGILSFGEEGLTKRGANGLEMTGWKT